MWYCNCYETRYRSRHRQILLRSPAISHIPTQPRIRTGPTRRRGAKLTFCSLCSAYSGMKRASGSAIPRSRRNFSNSSCTLTSKWSNCAQAWCQLRTAIRYAIAMHLWPNIQTPTLPVCIGSELRCQFGIRVICNVIQ